MTLRRADLSITALFLLAVAGVCWLVTVNRMEGMDMGPGTELGSLGWFTGVWVTMMAAMMLPSLAPKATVPFAAGFLIPWLGAGVAAYLLVQGVRSLDPAFIAWDEAGRYVAAGVIGVAAAWELTRAKHVCLRHCRAGRLPGMSLTREIRDGVVEGTYCIGCCWALMAALFALGVMSITWMIVIAALIAVEKLWSSEPVAKSATVVVLLALAIGVALFPDQVPGLTFAMSEQLSAPISM